MKYAGERKRALSKQEAQNCEDAKELVCRCRCNGAHHGAKRGAVGSLPLDDPHSPSRICPKCKGDGQDVYVGGMALVTFKCGKCQGTGRILPPGPKVKEQ